MGHEGRKHRLVYLHVVLVELVRRAQDELDSEVLHLARTNVEFRPTRRHFDRALDVPVAQAIERGVPEALRVEHTAHVRPPLAEVFTPTVGLDQCEVLIEEVFEDAMCHAPHLERLRAVHVGRPTPEDGQEHRLPALLHRQRVLELRRHAHRLKALEIDRPAPLPHHLMLCFEELAELAAQDLVLQLFRNLEHGNLLGRMPGTVLIEMTAPSCHPNVRLPLFSFDRSLGRTYAKNPILSMGLYKTRLKIIVLLPDVMPHFERRRAKSNS